MIAETTKIMALASRAVGYLLTQQPFPVTHEAGWKRDGFPLPIKRKSPDADGTTTQEYRPMAVLEYVHEVLSGEIAARAARDRKTIKDSGVIEVSDYIATPLEIQSEKKQ